MPSPCSPKLFSRSRDTIRRKGLKAVEIRCVHTCLGTPTLGPVLPVDIREPLGGMLTVIEERAQPRRRVGVSRFRLGAAMGYNDNWSELSIAGG